MKIEKFVLGIVSTNCFVVENEDTKECFIVDAPACSAELLGYIKRRGLKPVGITLTHGHFDHILGIDGLVEEFSMPVYAHESEREMLNDPDINLSSVYGEGYVFSNALYLKEGQSITLAGFDLRVCYTPGHTLGGCCYYMPKEAVIFTGDTLFLGTVGRTDLPSGDGELLLRSIKEQLMMLPDETGVYPGHNGVTTIGHEKLHNSFL